MGKWSDIITFENGKTIKMTEDEAVGFIKAHGKSSRKNISDRAMMIKTNDERTLYFMGRKKNRKNKNNVKSFAVANYELDLTAIGKEAAAIAQICFLDKNDLLREMYDTLKFVYEKRGLAIKINSDKYVFAEGDANVLLTAHVDTVHHEQCSVKNTTYNAKNNTLTSMVGIGGDDRCGIYIILKTIAKLSEDNSPLPTIAICNYEETGADGSRALSKDDKAVEYIKNNCKYMIELDRAGTDESVYYDCGNEEFKEYIDSKTKRTEHWGTFSDICELSPATDVASVNLSCGYKDAHTKREVIVVDEVIKCYEDVMMLIGDLDNVEQFSYMEERSFNNYSFGSLNSYSKFNPWDTYDDAYWDRYYSTQSSSYKASSWYTEYFTGAHIQYSDSEDTSKIYDKTIDLSPYKIKDKECAEYTAIGKLIWGSRRTITADDIIGVEVY